jgi:predicted phosphodiesterase
MRKLLTVILVALISNFVFAQTDIYDIQYTTVSGDGSYPSLYNGQNVTTGGIVTATEYLGGRYFISSSQGGAWNGIFIYDNNYSPTIGDSILITGLVYEYQGYTEIKDLTSFEVISSLNTLPEPAKIASADVSSEAYEGVLVELNSCTVSSIYDAYGNWWVNDGSGSCSISAGIFNLKDYGFPLILNYPFSKINGVIGINNYLKKLHPRTVDDIQSDDNALIISTDDKSVNNEANFELPVKISVLNQSEAISSYSLNIQYDAAVFEYAGYNKTGTVSESGTITDASTPGNIVLNFTGDTYCDDIDTLINIIYTPIINGDADLQFTGTTVNESAIHYYSIGTLEYESWDCSKPIADTLTIVQRPVLNIPSIVVPGQEFYIECFAPQSTTNWEAELLYDDITESLNITQSNYDTDLEKWTLTAIVPDPDIYELYDLRISASDGIVDTVRNAVKVIDQFKENYYFVHITDTHLPGKTYYGETGYETDHTELDDLLEVINDINLIHPEFVLLTGDLINEGELEDFECLRNHTLTVELLEKFEVPVYIVPGNHDLGGWESTPPSQGTARRDWWRFFGWRQREIPPVKTEYLSHDYSFNYGNTHFSGLESYDNYDSYMYEIYGDESFTASQIAWLTADLAAAGDMNKVLFYHYDFKGELNLSSLGVDMALWGHNHSNTGNIYSHPYNLSTEATCNGNRAYRLIRVNGNSFQPEYSVKSHDSGDMLTLDYNMVNDGSLDLVSATIQNNHSLSFSDGLIKFVMPVSDFGYNVTNGSLIQVLENGTAVICYVKVSIPANGQITATIEKQTSTIDMNLSAGEPVIEFFPNPFIDEINMKYEIGENSDVFISIHNIKGQLVKVLVNDRKDPGTYELKWNTADSEENKVTNGTYIYRFMLNGKPVSSGQILLLK